MNKFVINATPHDIHIVDEDNNQLVVIPRVPTDPIVRVSKTWTAPSAVLISGVSVPVRRAVADTIVGLPPERAGVILIVSGLVRTALPDRKDLFSPGTPVRNDAGQPIGCIGLEGNL